MTKSHKFGVKETLEKKSHSLETEIEDATNSTNKIDPHEQAYIQFEYQRNLEKIDEIYYKALDKLNDAHGEILDEIMERHKNLIKKKELSPKEKKRLSDISMGKL